eukprot:2963767-Rhodomonas_salina.4
MSGRQPDSGRLSSLTLWFESRRHKVVAGLGLTSGSARPVWDGSVQACPSRSRRAGSTISHGSAPLSDLTWSVSVCGTRFSRRLPGH